MRQRRFRPDSRCAHDYRSRRPPDAHVVVCGHGSTCHDCLGERAEKTGEFLCAVVTDGRHDWSGESIGVLFDRFAERSACHRDAPVAIDQPSYLQRRLLLLTTPRRTIRDLTGGHPRVTVLLPPGGRELRTARRCHRRCSRRARRPVFIVVSACHCLRCGSLGIGTAWLAAPIGRSAMLQPVTASVARSAAGETWDDETTSSQRTRRMAPSIAARRASRSVTGAAKLHASGMARATIWVGNCRRPPS